MLLLETASVILTLDHLLLASCRWSCLNHKEFRLMVGRKSEKLSSDAAFREFVHEMVEAEVC